MKSKTLFIRLIVFCYTIILLLFCLNVSGQVENKNINTTATHLLPSNSKKTIITKINNHTYTEKIIEKPGLNTSYKLLYDVKSVISDSLISLIVKKAEETEELFGLTPATFLKEIHFINDNDKSFFTPEKPSFVFVTVVANKKSVYCESDNDNDELTFLEREEHSRHEVCHLIDYYVKFSKDSAMTNFMNKLEKTKMRTNLFKLLYFDLSPKICFDDEVRQKFLDKHGNIGEIITNLGTSVSFIPEELFAQGITNLDSYYWGKIIKETKSDPKLFQTYKEMLLVFKRSIKRCLSKIASNPEDISEIPIMILLDMRIDQMNKM